MIKVGTINLKCIIFYILNRNRLLSEHRIWLVFDFDPLSIVTNSRQYLVFMRKVTYQGGRCISVTNPRIRLKKKYNSNSIIEKYYLQSKLIISPLNFDDPESGMFHLPPCQFQISI